MIQLIESSNISAHFDEESNDIYLDVFSCQTFSPKKAEAVFRKFFKPTYVEAIFMTRQAKHT